MALVQQHAGHDKSENVARGLEALEVIHEEFRVLGEAVFGAHSDQHSRLRNRGNLQPQKELHGQRRLAKRLRPTFQFLISQV